MLTADVERCMARYVVERVHDGDLPDLAASEACDEHEVFGAERAEFIDRYASFSVRVERLLELAPSRVATVPRRVDPCWPGPEAA